MILLVTDVLIDVALDRRPHADAAAKLLDRVERGLHKACIAWHTVSNFYYLVAPSRGGASAREFVVVLTGFVGIAATNTESIRYAASLPISEFEDAMQAAAALACGAERIVTRNLSDFRRSPVPAISPQDALAELF